MGWPVDLVPTASVGLLIVLYEAMAHWNINEEVDMSKPGGEIYDVRAVASE